MVTDEVDPTVVDRAHLRADCASCFGLCCVALAFSRSSQFAIDKAVGEPCGNLQDDFRCGIHAQLRPRGFSGCTVYDCFGAGQQVSRVTFAGQDWRTSSTRAEQMFAVFPIMRQLHELLYYLADARSRPAASSVHAELDALRDEIGRLALLDPVALRQLDVAAVRARVSPLLRRASELQRAGVAAGPRRSPDLAGARLRRADLRGADLRGACLIAADLRDADLRLADLIGADLRDADLRGADLADALFLAQAQVNAARGDGRTVLPPALVRPAHWS